MPDVVVIGGGMAGCWAAATAASAGARVTLVRRALGATAVSAGPVDFVPPLEAGEAAGWLGRLARTDPQHPYVESGGGGPVGGAPAEAGRAPAAPGGQRAAQGGGAGGAPASGGGFPGVGAGRRGPRAPAPA